MIPISDTNKLPNSCNKDSAREKGAMRLDDYSHDFIMEEIVRRGGLEDKHSNSNDDENLGEDEGNSSDEETSSSSSSSSGSSSSEESG